jgi:hypothetical protein
MQTTNIIRTTVLVIATAFADRVITAEARKINVICARRRTVVYKDTHQKSTSVLRKYIKHDLI